MSSHSRPGTCGHPNAKTSRLIKIDRIVVYYFSIFPHEALQAEREHRGLAG